MIAAKKVEMSKPALSNEAISRMAEFLANDKEFERQYREAQWYKNVPKKFKDWFSKWWDQGPEEEDVEDSRWLYEAPVAEPEPEPEKEPVPPTELFPTVEEHEEIEEEKVPEVKEPESKGYEGLIWIPVESSNVQSFAYDMDERDLYVKFLAKGNSPGSTYVYYNVEPDIYDAFIAAESKGKFIHTHLKNRYEYARLD